MDFIGSTNLIVKIHSGVLFSIIDSYERRNDSQSRVIGSLLGYQEKGAVVIKNCICIPHSESEDEVAVDMEFAKSMLESYKKVESSEAIVGWYATGADITNHSVLIHDYYSREANNPVHLIVDTTLRDGRTSCKAFISTSYGVSSKNSGIMFVPCQIEHVAYDCELVGLRILQETKFNKQRSTEITSDLDMVYNAISKILRLTDVVLAFIDEVLSNQTTQNNAIGRILMDMIGSLPQINPEEFSEMINNCMKDILTSLCMAELLKNLVSLHEKTIYVADWK